MVRSDAFAGFLRGYIKELEGKKGVITKTFAHDRISRIEWVEETGLLDAQLQVLKRIEALHDTWGMDRQLKTFLDFEVQSNERMFSAVEDRPDYDFYVRLLSVVSDALYACLSTLENE